MRLVNAAAAATWHAKKPRAEYFMRKPICENWIAPRYITATAEARCKSSCKQIRSCSSWRKTRILAACDPIKKNGAANNSFQTDLFVSFCFVPSFSANLLFSLSLQALSDEF
jgi:hypothetical protein